MFKKLIILSIFIVVSALISAPVFAQVSESELANPEAGGCRITATGATVKKVQAKVGVTQDGVLGPITCNAIKAYQCTKNLSVDGNVGPITWGVMQGSTPPSGTRICADLKNQTLWLSRNGRRVYTAERMRSGDSRLSQSSPTKTGNHSVYWKDLNHVSSIFGTPMPYSLFFYGDQAIHASYFSQAGSHGCINVTYPDAFYLWVNTVEGTPVSIWGSRPL